MENTIEHHDMVVFTKGQFQGLEARVTEVHETILGNTIGYDVRFNTGFETYVQKDVVVRA